MSRTRSLLVYAAFAISSVALAQGVTGSALIGNVTDQQNNPLPDVVITVRNESTGLSFTAVTDEQGSYLLDNLPPGGPYELTATSATHYGVTRKGMVLALGNRLRLDIKLKQFEAMEENVVVVGADVDRLEDKSRTGASTEVGTAALEGLPLQGRNFTDLIATAPQVSGNSMAGQNNRFNNIQIDGAAYNDLFGLSGSGTPGGQAGAKALSLEAIETFVVSVSPFDVRYGNFAGGMVNAVTKSGTNDFRGSLFTYLQNKVLAGNQSDPAFLGYNTWQFGGSLGGPIIKDKVHFFIAADLQERTSAFGNNFQIGGTNADEDYARAGFTTVEADRFTSILRDRYGVTNAGTALATNLDNPDRNVFAKVSTSVIPNSYLELSYNFVNAYQDNLTRAPTAPTIPGRLRDGYQLSNAGYAQTTNTHTGRVKLVSTFLNGSLSNEFLAGFSLIRDERDPGMDIPLILVNVQRPGGQAAWLAAGAERFSQLNELDQDIYQLQDTVSLKLGDHTISLGTSNEFLNLRNAFFQARTGVWAFNNLDDFENGVAAAFQRRFGVSDLQEPGTAKFTVAQFGVYLQDNWNVFKGLTITPGIRLDIPFLSDAVTNPSLLDGPLPIDTGVVPSGNLLWSPRLGFNWDVENNANTIVRGGVGVFSGRPPYVWVANAYSVNGLSQVELTCRRGTTAMPDFTVDPNAQPTDCLGGTSPPTAPTNAGEIDYFDRKTKYPQNFRVALGADRKLPWDLTGTLDLLYMQDINGWYTTDKNLVAQGTSGEGRQLYGSFAASGFRANPTRVDAGSTARLNQAVIVYNKNGARNLSATVQLQKRFRDALDVSAAYTYTNAVDRISLTSSQAFSNLQFAPLDGTLEDRNIRPSAFDRPHRIQINAIGQLPYGFNAGLIYTGQSGLPYTWVVGEDLNADGIGGNDTPFIPDDPSQITLQDPTQYDALQNFIEGQDCLKAARGTLLQRGACRNPWQNFLNVRLGWTAPEFIKGQRLELQVDIFNVLNLIYNRWGLFEQDAQFETHGSRFLRAVGYDAANNRPIYQFTEPTRVTSIIYSPTSSRWRIQAGLRYVF